MDEALRIDPARGFLPAEDQVHQLPMAIRVWDEIGAALPSLLAARRVRTTLADLPVLSARGLDQRAAERAMMLLICEGIPRVNECPVIVSGC